MEDEILTSPYNSAGRTQGFCLPFVPAAWGKDPAGPWSGCPAKEGSRPGCSVCGPEGPGDDALPSRRLEFVPFRGIAFFFIYASACGVKVKSFPWSDGRHRQTRTYVWLPAAWAKRLSWSEAAEAFHTPGIMSSRPSGWGWTGGRSQMNLDGVAALGADEMAWGGWHRFELEGCCTSYPK